jgi:hypothetical protein
MASIAQENLETVMIDFFGALRRGDLEAASGLLDPDVSWQGLREEWVCHGRDEVLNTFRWGLEQRREIDALEFTRAAGRRCALFGLLQLGSLERGPVEYVVLARLEAVEVEMIEHFAEDHGAGDDHRRPVGIECRDLPAFRERQRREALELRADVSGT